MAQVQDSDLRIFENIENYIYLYHLNTFIYFPIDPESISDSTGIRYSESQPLSRTAPIYSYSNSGPRSVLFKFDLHREMFKQIKYQDSKIAELAGVDDDYCDVAIRLLQSCAYPTFNNETKQINPPVVAVKLGNDVFIKGVIDGTVGVNYTSPGLRNGKYAMVSLTLTVKEVEPFDAGITAAFGSFRGMDSQVNGLINKTALITSETYSSQSSNNGSYIIPGSEIAYQKAYTFGKPYKD